MCVKFDVAKCAVVRRVQNHSTWCQLQPYHFRIVQPQQRNELHLLYDGIRVCDSSSSPFT